MVVPVHDEVANIAPLIAEIDAALSGRIAFEIVYVGDAPDSSRKKGQQTTVLS